MSDGSGWCAGRTACGLTGRIGNDERGRSDTQSERCSENGCCRTGHERETSGSYQRCKKVIEKRSPSIRGRVGGVHASGWPL